MNAFLATGIKNNLLTFQQILIENKVTFYDFVDETLSSCVTNFDRHSFDHGIFMHMVHIHALFYGTKIRGMNDKITRCKKKKFR